MVSEQSFFRPVETDDEFALVKDLKFYLEQAILELKEISAHQSLAYLKFQIWLQEKKEKKKKGDAATAPMPKTLVAMTDTSTKAPDALTAIAKTELDRATTNSIPQTPSTLRFENLPVEDKPLPDPELPTKKGFTTISTPLVLKSRNFRSSSADQKLPPSDTSAFAYQLRPPSPHLRQINRVSFSGKSLGSYSSRSFQKNDSKWSKISLVCFSRPRTCWKIKKKVHPRYWYSSKFVRAHFFCWIRNIPMKKLRSPNRPNLQLQRTSNWKYRHYCLCQDHSIKELKTEIIGKSTFSPYKRTCTSEKNSVGALPRTPQVGVAPLDPPPTDRAVGSATYSPKGLQSASAHKKMVNISTLLSLLRSVHPCLNSRSPKAISDSLWTSCRRRGMYISSYILSCQSQSYSEATSAKPLVITEKHILTSILSSAITSIDAKYRRVNLLIFASYHLKSCLKTGQRFFRLTSMINHVVLHLTVNLNDPVLKCFLYDKAEYSITSWLTFRHQSNERYGIVQHTLLISLYEIKEKGPVQERPMEFESILFPLPSLVPKIKKGAHLRGLYPAIVNKILRNRPYNMKEIVEISIQTENDPRSLYWEWKCSPHYVNHQLHVQTPTSTLSFQQTVNGFNKTKIPMDRSSRTLTTSSKALPNATHTRTMKKTNLRLNDSESLKLKDKGLYYYCDKIHYPLIDVYEDFSQTEDEHITEGALILARDNLRLAHRAISWGMINILHMKNEVSTVPLNVGSTTHNSNDPTTISSALYTNEEINSEVIEKSEGLHGNAVEIILQQLNIEVETIFLLLFQPTIYDVRVSFAMSRSFKKAMTGAEQPWQKILAWFNRATSIPGKRYPIYGFLIQTVCPRDTSLHCCHHHSGLQRTPLNNREDQLLEPSGLCFTIIRRTRYPRHLHDGVNNAKLSFMSPLPQPWLCHRDLHLQPTPSKPYYTIKPSCSSRCHMYLPLQLEILASPLPHKWSPMLNSLGLTSTICIPFNAGRVPHAEAASTVSRPEFNTDIGIYSVLVPAQFEQLEDKLSGGREVMLRTHVRHARNRSASPDGHAETRHHSPNSNT